MLVFLLTKLYQLMQRRSFILSALSLSLLTKNFANKQSKKLKILVAGGHPDDPETGCGGSIAKWTAAGYEVTVAYLTQGEAGIPHKNYKEAASLRIIEAKKACKILKAKPVFLGQIDGNTIINKSWYAKIALLLKTEKPDVIFCHWPIDSHKDHVVCSVVFQDAWLNSTQKASFFYYEVLAGVQTFDFKPTHYSNITLFKKAKELAVLQHKSQFGIIYDPLHQKMEETRGAESKVMYAEAFVKHEKSKDCELFNF